MLVLEHFGSCASGSRPARDFVGRGDDGAAPLREASVMRQSALPRRRPQYE
jgi:hypothetical protein